MSLLTTLFANPQLVVQHRNILLLSHMRANTSLFGHLLGSHPLVEGYYEQHIGYYGWKSLWRQKMLHFAEHKSKPGARWMFDKVLHDGHAVARSILKRPDTRAILMLRDPRQTLPSLVTLYRRERPHLPEATAAGASQYYVQRLEGLVSMAAHTPRYFYLDAESLVDDTEGTLAALERWLGFEQPIPREYHAFARTGRSGAGDTSARLQSGRVSRVASNYDDIEFDPALLTAADDAYQRCRARLIANADTRVTIDRARAP